MTLRCLPPSTIKLIGSSQVITCVSAAVKELVENALDAGALSIDVKLENHGLEKIEVKDDGCGISKDDVQRMCKKSYTSKISDFSDLDDLHSYGFRGEALNALCAVSKLAVTTKTDADTLAQTYYFDSDGSVKDSKLSHVNKGTIVVAEGLFRNLPVRRQFLTSGRRKSEEIKKVESIVKSLAIIHPRLRLTFAHNKFLIWQKNSVSNLKQSLAQAIPPTIISQLDTFHYSNEETSMEMDVLLPKKSCNISVTCYSNRDDAFYLFINLRPVKHKELEKTLESELFQYFGHYIPANKYPLCLLSIKLPPDGLDVNLEPNKTKVVVKDLDNLIVKIKAQFVKYYTGLNESIDAKTPVDIKLPKRKLEPDKDDNISDNCKIQKIGTDEVLEPSCSNDKVEDCRERTVPIVNDSLPVNINAFDEIQLRNFSVPHDRETSAHGGNNCFDNSDGIGSFELKSNDIKEDILCPTDLDELESILAGSSQSSIMVEPDINFTSDEKLSSQNSDEKSESSQRICYGQKEDISSGNILTFMNDLPTRIDDDRTGSLKNVATMEFNENRQEQNSDQKNNNLNNLELNYDNITLSQWSKGHVLEPTIVPVTIEKQTRGSGVKEVEEDLSDGTDIFMNKKMAANDCSSQMDRSVSSQMGCKNMSAFTKFARDMRTKIVQQTPGISFTRVASELASKWRDLDDDQRHRYEESAREDKLKGRDKKDDTPEAKLIQTTIKTKKPNEPLKGLKKIKYDKCALINFTIDDLRARTKAGRTKETNHPQILFKLDDDLFIFSSDNCLSVLSSLRLNEVINYYKNMSTMAVPLKTLEKNIPVRAEDVGEKNWHTLHCLETSVDLRNSTVVIANELITKNGFRIEVTDGFEGKRFEITDVPLHVSFYGVDDLKEILETMDRNGISSNLIGCRPLKIASFIRSETIRMCSKAELNINTEAQDSMFNFWIKNVKKMYPDCPHRKPVAKELFKYNEFNYT